MRRLSDGEILEIAGAREIEYEAIADDDPLVVRTRMSRVLPIEQATAFDAFSDPMAHVPLFEIIKGSTPAIRRGVEKLIPENQFLAFEHVEEGGLPPRLMLVKYTLERPLRIVKEAVTDPFLADDIQVMDKKKGLVKLEFEKVADASTRIIAESTFRTTTGAVFARGFVDHVWLNFFERLLLSRGLLAENQFLTAR